MVNFPPPLLEALHFYITSQETASRQHVVRMYFSLIKHCLDQFQENCPWMEVFEGLNTDFERVSYLLELLRKIPAAVYSVTPTAVRSARELLTRNNGKLDQLSSLFQMLSRQEWGDDHLEDALDSSTLAVFYASSAERISQAMAHRAIILYALGLLDEAIHDATEALKTPVPREIDLTKINLCLGQCYKHKGEFSEAIKYFESALNVLGENEQTEYENTKQCTLRGLDECRELSTNDSATVSESLWKCFCPEHPELKTGGNDSTTEDNPNTSCSLLSAKGILHPKNTGSDAGWTLAVSRDVKAGEFVLVEKAYAASLSKGRNEYCYSCHRPCCNLIPCKGCPHVGFCSTVCAENAARLDTQRLTGVNGHIYDCHGVLPCILLKVMRNAGLSQIAHACIANTDPQRLLDYICSTGVYQGGRGHQAFVGSNVVREHPPPVFDPADYSSVAWLSTCSHKINTEERWKFTVAAVFLTYCLFVGGYQMDWVGNMNMNLPSPINRPECIPASWVAACLLYHLQSAEITHFSLLNRLNRESRQQMSEYTELGVIVYPTIALVNHSCNPSAFVTTTTGGFASLITLKPLSAGSEISIAYILTYASGTLSTRRRVLKYFDCKCEACSENWAILGEVAEVLICPSCHNKCRRSPDSTDFVEVQPAITDSTGPDCRHSSIAARYHKLLHEDLQAMESCMITDTVNSEMIKLGSEALDSAHSLIIPPAYSLIRLEETFQELIYFKRGSWVLKPWLRSN